MHGIMYILRQVGARVKETGAVYWRCFYSVTLTIAGALGLASVPQGLECLRLVSQPGWNFPLFLVSVAAWSLAAWYSARLTLGRVFDGHSLLDHAHSPYVRSLRTWLPRCLGVVPSALLTLTFYRLREPVLALACAGAGATIGVFVVKRRAWFATRFQMRQNGSEESMRFAALQRRTVITVAGAIALSFALLFALWWRPVEVAAVITAPVLLCFAFASWILFGDLVLTYFFKQAGLPSMAAAPLLLFLVFSLTNDNHAVALIAGDSSPMIRRDIDRHLDAWLDARVASGDLRRGAPFPLYLAAAEGGGIRAAYWTGIVLAKLQDDSGNRFARHLFAMSGVSGGSLAVSSFAALVADGQDGALARAPCARANPARPYQQCIRSLLRRDFLSPTLGYLLYPDMLQRFLPYPIASADRARAMEMALDDGWRQATGSERFAQRFDHLWQGAGAYQVPSLLLNATLVAGGNRVIASDLVIDGRFPDAYDAFDPLLDLRRMSLATAIHNSARFSYVSPAGTVYACRRGAVLAPCAPGLERAPWGRLIDGGYFENSGMESLRDLLFALRPGLARWAAAGYRIVPSVIMISNSPGALAPSGKQDPGGVRLDMTFLSELLAPPMGLFYTRAARATFAVTAERRDMAVTVPDDGGRFLWFGVTTRNDTPLGWALADVTFNGMDQLLAPEPGAQLARLPFDAVSASLGAPAQKR